MFEVFCAGVLQVLQDRLLFWTLGESIELGPVQALQLLHQVQVLPLFQKIQVCRCVEMCQNVSRCWSILWDLSCSRWTFAQPSWWHLGAFCNFNFVILAKRFERNKLPGSCMRARFWMFCPCFYFPLFSSCFCSKYSLLALKMKERQVWHAPDFRWLCALGSCPELSSIAEGRWNRTRFKAVLISVRYRCQIQSRDFYSGAVLARCHSDMTWLPWLPWLG